MKRRLHFSRVRFLLQLSVFAAFVALRGGAQTNTIGDDLVAWYTFAEEDTAGAVRDHSRYHNDGTIVGPYTWGKPTNPGLVFDGTAYVRVPTSSSLELSRAFSLIALFKGRGASQRFVEHPGDDDLHIRRSPYFQVCGDKLFFAYNTDVENRLLPLWIGTALINLSGWQDRYAGTEGLEPKLQVLSDGIEYEYFGRDGLGIWQIWTATSSLDLSHFLPVEQTFRLPVAGRDPYGVEQALNIQVVGNQVFWAFPMTDRNDFQLSTARAARDGSQFTALQRTTGGSWVPMLQVAGDSTYYLFVTSPSGVLTIAKSSVDGSNWRTLAEFKGVSSTTKWGYLAVDKDRLFYEYSARSAQNMSELVTGSMSLDGSGLTRTVRPVRAHVVFPGGIQVVGNRVFYSYAQGDTLADNPYAMNLTSWIGTTDRDNSNWEARKLALTSPSTLFGYKPFVVVGGKVYYSAETFHSRKDERPFLGTSGANLVAKGDSFGLGLSDTSDVTAFINAGQDYLYAGQAPVDTGGAVGSGAPVDTEWHEAAAVYDGHALTLYIDGVKQSVTPYNLSPRKNDFPLLLGDGLVGSLKNVRVFDQALDTSEIQKLYAEDTLTGAITTIVKLKVP